MEEEEGKLRNEKTPYPDTSLHWGVCLPVNTSLVTVI